MNTQSRLLLKTAGALLAFCFAWTTAHAALAEGRDYKAIQQRPTNDPAKIEVLEFFSWGCSHCYELYPHLAAWEAKLPKDVVLVKSAVSVGFDQWVPLARAYYAFDFNGDAKRMDPLVFKAIHEQRVNLFTDENLAAWAQRQGIDRTKFLAALQSMGVESKFRQAEANSKNIPIEGTPTLIVDGKYMLVGAGANSYADWPPLLDQLIAKVRAERAARK